MKRILLLALLFLVPAVFLPDTAAAQLKVSVAGTAVTVSGTPIPILNNAGAMQVTFEELITGSPSTVSIVIQGCMQGGTCDTLETNTSTSGGNRSPTISKPYDKFVITPSWTGGTNVTFTVNVTLTTAQSGSGGGSGGAVASVYGRTGAVVASGGDYSVGQVTNAAKVQTCTNQVLSAVDATGASANCKTINSNYVDNSIAQTGSDINTSNQVTVTHLAAGLPVNQGGTSLQTLTAHALPIGNGASAPNFLPSPTTNGPCQVLFNVTAAAPVDPTCSLPGVSVNAQSGNYTLLYSDRGVYLKFSGGTTATLTLAQITGATASNLPFVVQNLNSGNLTLTANAADSIDGGSTGGSITVLPNFAVFVYQDSSAAPGNWWTIKLPTFAAYNASQLTAVANATFNFAAGGAASAGAVTADTSKIWGPFSIPESISSTKIGFHIQTADNSANPYDLGLFSQSGSTLTEVCHLGATAGTTFANATGAKSLSWTGGGCLIPGGSPYYLVMTGHVATAILGGQGGVEMWQCGVAAASGGGTTGGLLNTSMTLSADSYTSCTVPQFSIK
jgi:hypothetical protein